MPLYEYHCEKCDRVFEALRPVGDSDRPATCSECGSEGERIMPTSFAPRSFRQGFAERVPFHHRPVRADEQKRTIAPVRAKKQEGSRGRASGRRKR
jgi:putative FmdB family regulatory protein